MASINQRVLSALDVHVVVADLVATARTLALLALRFCGCEE